MCQPIFDEALALTCFSAMVSVAQQRRLQTVQQTNLGPCLVERRMSNGIWNGN
jgi:hypothetical protein